MRLLWRVILLVLILPAIARGQITVTGFNPPQGREGDLIQISGSGFGSNPNDLAVAIRPNANATTVPMRVVQASDTMIVARLGPVPPPAGIPGSIVVMRASGGVGSFTPQNPDVIPEDPTGVWTWNRNGDQRIAASTANFTPIFQPPQTGQQWFFGQVIGGNLVLTVPTTLTLQPNTTLRLIARLDNVGQAVGTAIEGMSIRLRVGGDAQYLLSRVRDALDSILTAQGVLHNIVQTGNQLTVIRLSAGGPPIPTDLGHLDVCIQDPIRINPFQIGPVTAFFHANLSQQGTSALLSNLGDSGNDGGTISPNVGVTGGLLVRTAPIALTPNGGSFTLTGWGTVGGVGGRLIGNAKLQRNSSTILLTGGFTPLGTNQVQLEVYHNTLFAGAASLSAGTLAQILGGANPPNIIKCGVIPTGGAGTVTLWIQLDSPVSIVPTGGGSLFGNQIRLHAGGLPVNVGNVQHVDIAGGFPGLDVGMIVVLDSLEGGICYANCDDSSTPPILNVNDFLCFQMKFAAGEAYANCDGSVGAPTLTVNDFVCFQTAFVMGCTPN